MENKQLSPRQKWTNIIGILVVIGALLTIAYLINLKFGPASEERFIELTVPEAGSIIYIDGEEIQITDNTDEDITIKDQTPELHTVIVAKNNFWPWKKEVDLSKRDAHIATFLVPQEPVITVVAAGSPEYSDALTLLNASRLPLETMKATSTEEDVAIWVTNDEIMAEWVDEKDDNPNPFFCRGSNCAKKINVLTSTTPITRAAFYKDRSDVLLFSTGEWIYALEVDTDGTQNFQPVYKGTAPIFAPGEDGVIYVKDGTRIVKVTL